MIFIPRRSLFSFRQPKASAACFFAVRSICKIKFNLDSKVHEAEVMRGIWDMQQSPRRTMRVKPNTVEQMI